MAELIPISLAHLLTRVHHEYQSAGAIFDLPSRKFHRPSGDLDLSVSFCGNRAANPIGPAAGPHTQLAQNIVLSWLAGSRIIELKTVQINDRLQLTRPCIDMATIGYNTEWSQELLLEESLREYVKAWMMIHVVAPYLSDSAEPHRATLPASVGVVFDLSVGYDLAGIQSPQIRSWFRGMRNASHIIDELRHSIPPPFHKYRDLTIPHELANSITLSTFHGTPADEIERICEFLLTELDLHVIIKMNPPMLGKKYLEHLLFEKLGYLDVEVNQKIYDVNISFPDAVDVVRRLQGVAARVNKTIGVKFGNTLEVINKGAFLKDKVQYLSGQPLHVLHLALVAEWRKVFGPDFPISFSAGVDANNVADMAGIGLVPITTCTDLLRPGGYGRLPQYLTNLEKQMRSVGARTIPEFILRSSRVSEPSDSSSLGEAILSNTTVALEKAINNPRYHASANRKTPRKIGSHLHLWDCINCDKCIPVCPNDANFYFEVEPVEIHYKNIEICGRRFTEVDGGTFQIKERHQIGTYADACNECGNCDVFCPEDGGPYIEKPRFFGSFDAYSRWNALSGFHLSVGNGSPTLYGRFGNKEFVLWRDSNMNMIRCRQGAAELTVEIGTYRASTASTSSIERNDVDEDCYIDMRYVIVMDVLLQAMMDKKRIHFVNSVPGIDQEISDPR